MNSDKSHLLVLAGRGAMSARRMEVQLQPEPDTIEQSTTEKLLGGVVQNTGGWKQIIRDGKNSVIFQLNSRLNPMKKLKNAHFKTKLSVSTGLIQSKIQCLLPLYGGAPNYLINCIQVKQLQASRFVCGYATSSGLPHSYWRNAAGFLIGNKNSTQQVSWHTK